MMFDQRVPAHKGTSDLGFAPKPKFESKAAKRKELISILKKETEEKRLAILHGYEMQNNWMSFGLDKRMDLDLSWNSMIYRYSEQLTKFVLNGTLQTLPTPDNLRRWGIATNICCGLCGKSNVTLKHILAGCSWVFHTESNSTKEDRYLWRHNCCLLRLARAIFTKLKLTNGKPKANTRNQSSHIVKFVSAGTKPVKSSKPAETSILDRACDWKCNFDLPEFHSGKKNKLIFPHDICAMEDRPDAYILSREEKICILGPEMTSPMDDNVFKWHMTKRTKYSDKVSHVQGWTFFDLALEVGALGWIPPSTKHLLKVLGFSNKEIKVITKDLQYLARKCSYVIYINRFNKDFHPWRLDVEHSSLNELSHGLLDIWNTEDQTDASAPTNENFDGNFADELEIELECERLAAAKTYEPLVAAKPSWLISDDPGLDLALASLPVPGDIFTPRPVAPDVDIVPVVRILQLDSTCIAIYQKHKQNTLFRPKLQRILENGSDNTIHFLSSIITD
jgi:hypothetical protein